MGDRVVNSRSLFFRDNMEFTEIRTEDSRLEELSSMAVKIVKEYYDPLLGPEQNDYMIEKFQSVKAIKGQLEHGYRYFIVSLDGINLGFLAFYPRNNALYLSKFYLYAEHRGKGYASHIIGFLKEMAAELGLKSIELNVNKYNISCRIYEALGFKKIRSEKNDIGSGFFMDDFVYSMILY